MANTYFNFKKFSIQQDKCAMKVCTDSCLFGAWAAQKIQGNNIKDILDIGTGTGLLSLMLAQKINANIDAVEIDTDAAEQASGNFSVSPWNKRLKVFNIPAQELDTEKKYECIISNPPFFENDLHSPKEGKNTAKHDSGLTYVELIHIIDNYLINDGHAMVMIPFHRLAHFEKVASEAYLYPEEKMYVKQSPYHENFRVCIALSRKRIGEKNISIAIHDEKGNYTNEFRELLKEYYLAF